MTQKELIRQEIERRIKLYSITNEKEQWIVNTYWSVLSFIDSLPECEETAKIPTEKYEEELNEEIQGFIDEYGYERGEDKILIAIVARHFAEWEAKCKESLQIPETCKENTDSFTSLEEAADEYADKHGFRVPYDGSNNYYDDVDIKASKDGFIAGAEWQKEQMMKEVKYGVVCKNGERDEEDVWIELNPGSLPDYKDTDPIDFIIVKQ